MFSLENKIKLKISKISYLSSENSKSQDYLKELSNIDKNDIKSLSSLEQKLDLHIKDLETNIK